MILDTAIFSAGNSKGATILSDDFLIVVLERMLSTSALFSAPCRSNPKNKNEVYAGGGYLRALKHRAARAHF